MAELQLVLTCSGYTISPQSYNKVDVEKTLDNITWIINSTAVQNGAEIIDNKLYTLINGLPGYIDFNTFETKIIDNTSAYPSDVNFVYNPYRKRLNILYDGESGTQYDMNNNYASNDIYLNITAGILNTINVYNSNNEYQIIMDYNNNYHLYDMYELNEIYYFDSSNFKLLYSFMYDNYIYYKWNK